MLLSRSLLLLVLCWILHACDAKLPEPETPAARLYATRCSSGCHRIYAPGLMKYEMWKLTVERMRKEYPAKGLPPLTPREEEIVLDYLQRHAG